MCRVLKTGYKLLSVTNGDMDKPGFISQNVSRIEKHPPSLGNIYVQDNFYYNRTYVLLQV